MPATSAPVTPMPPLGWFQPRYKESPSVAHLPSASSILAGRCAGGLTPAERAEPSTHLWLGTHLGLSSLSLC